MNDLIERLRRHERWPIDAHHEAMEAADEIERLRTPMISIELLHELNRLLSGKELAIETKLDQIMSELKALHERIINAGL